MSLNVIGDDGIEALSLAFGQLSNLQVRPPLDLLPCPCEHVDVPHHEGERCLTFHLPLSKSCNVPVGTLETRSFFYPWIEGSCLHGSMCAQVLNLARNSVTAVGAQALASTIHHLESLRNLSLKFNDIGVHGIRSLAPQLTPLAHLEKLDLEGNGIGEIGATALAIQFRALGRSLHTLKLGMNRIGEGGAGELATSLSFLSHLVDLGLGRNELRDNGVCQILSALTALGSLTTLSLYRCCTLLNHSNQEFLCTCMWSSYLTS